MDRPWHYVVMTGIYVRRLSVGFRRKVGPIIGLFIASWVLLPATALTGSMVTMGVVWLIDRDISSDTQSRLGGVGGLLAATVTLTFLVLSAARRIRTGAWVEGTRLSVRRVRTRTVDLMRATSVSITSRSEALAATSAAGRPLMAVRTPVLVVTGPGGPIALRLRSPEGALLPPEEMLALAAALSEARCPGAAEATAWLRAIASDPRSLLA